MQKTQPPILSAGNEANSEAEPAVSENALAGRHWLSDISDALNPDAFPKRRSKIHYFAEIGSTMKKARELAIQGCPHFSLVIAERQREGRGRMDRTWVSEKGGLYFTIILKPNITSGMMGRVAFAASVCLAKSIKDVTGAEAGIKWPNDIVIGDKKVSGMLCQMVAEGNAISYLNIGIGLNVNNDPPELEAKYAAISLKQALGRKVSRKKILARFLDLFEETLSRPLDQTVLEEWRKLSVSLNRKVRVEMQEEIVVGRALDADESGALLVELDDGSVRSIFFGDCFHAQV